MNWYYWDGNGLDWTERKWKRNTGNEWYMMEWKRNYVKDGVIWRDKQPRNNNNPDMI